MGRTGSRHPDDDERLLDGDRLDFGMPLDQFGQRQSVAQQANHPLPQGRARELGQAGVGLDSGRVCGQPARETVRVVQVVADTGRLNGFGEHPIDVELDAFGLGEFQNPALDIGQPGRGQIFEVDVVDVADRRTHATASSPTG
jgi:hypothetical protein